MRERDIAVDNLGARVKVILFPKGKEYCIADREANDDYCRQRLAVVSFVSLDLKGGCVVDLSVAVGGDEGLRLSFEVSRGCYRAESVSHYIQIRLFLCLKSFLIGFYQSGDGLRRAASVWSQN